MQRVNDIESFARIRVIGVGGGGNNAVNRMLEESMPGVDFIAVNTDSQALLMSNAATRLRIGGALTRGLGAGGDPTQGASAAQESLDDIEEALVGSDMVFVTAGMGGGTGTGAAPVVARAAKAAGALTIGVVTRPFMFEGSRRTRLAEGGIAQLKEHVDTLIVIPNDRLLELSNQRMTLAESFRLADDVLLQAIRGISQLITVPGLINLDFADVKAIMAEGGAALMAMGYGSGEGRARIAAESALNNRLLDVTIDGARGILFNVTGGPDMSLNEINEAASIIRETAHPDANMIFGAVVDETLGDELRVTVIATGFERAVAQDTFHPVGLTLDRARREAPARGPVARQPAAPAAERRAEVALETEDHPAARPPRFSLDNLDIPAFLRRAENGAVH